MTKKQYQKLKVGDVVSLQLGKNKGEKAIVTFIYDDEDRSEPLFGWIEAKFINPDLCSSRSKSTGSTTLSYKAFKYEGLNVNSEFFSFILLH